MGIGFGIYDSMDPTKIVGGCGLRGDVVAGYLEMFKSSRTVVLCDGMSLAQTDAWEPRQIEFGDITRVMAMDFESYESAMRVIMCFEDSKDEDVGGPKPKMSFCQLKVVYNVPTLEEFIETPYVSLFPDRDFKYTNGLFLGMITF